MTPRCDSCGRRVPVEYLPDPALPGAVHYWCAECYDRRLALRRAHELLRGAAEGAALKAAKAAVEGTP